MVGCSSCLVVKFELCIFMNSLASSDTGTKLALASPGLYIQTSVDSGVTWKARTSVPSNYWASIASSSDGMMCTCIVTTKKNL